MTEFVGLKNYEKKKEKRQKRQKFAGLKNYTFMSS